MARMPGSLRQAHIQPCLDCFSPSMRSLTGLSSARRWVSSKSSFFNLRQDRLGEQLIDADQEVPHRLARQLDAVAVRNSLKAILREVA